MYGLRSRHTYFLLELLGRVGFALPLWLRMLLYGCRFAVYTTADEDREHASRFYAAAAVRRFSVIMGCQLRHVVIVVPFKPSFNCLAALPRRMKTDAIISAICPLGVSVVTLAHSHVIRGPCAMDCMYLGALHSGEVSCSWISRTCTVLYILEDHVDVALYRCAAQFFEVGCIISRGHVRCENYEL